MYRIPYRTVKTCWSERREHVQIVSKWLSLVALGIWTTAIAVAIPGSQPATTTVPLAEHAEQIMSAQMYIILALAGGYIAIVSYIYVSNIKDLKTSIRSHHDTMKAEVVAINNTLKGKVSIQVHNAICEHKIEEER